MLLSECASFAARRLLEHALQSSLITLLVAFVLYIIGNEVARSRARIARMRGPRSLPIIGNLLQMGSNPSEKFEEWAHEYGDVYQVQMGNLPVVVVNGAAAAKALWITNSQALASRPYTYTFHRIASSTAGFTIGSSPYDNSLKRRKKGAAVALNKPAIQSYIPYLDMESRTFLRDLLTYGKGGTMPIDPLPMIQRLALSLSVTINWGVRIESHEDPLFKEIVEVEEELNRVRSVVGNYQDWIPLLRLNPMSPSSARARELRNRRDQYLRRMNSELAEKVAKGTNKPCIQANVIKYKEAKLNDTELMSISLSMLGGGFETVANTVQFTMGYLARHPRIQDVAYKEICEFLDKTGHYKHSLCDAADDMKCEYIHAFAQEALRYFTVVPLALPRESIREIVYEGARIPKGTTFYMNATACNHDRRIWTDPEVFRPERWLETPDAPLFTYGLGYRMCAGHLLATRELYLIFMRLLSSFRLEQYGVVDCEPKTGCKNTADLIMAPSTYDILCIPRDEQFLRRALEEFKLDS